MWRCRGPGQAQFVPLRSPSVESPRGRRYFGTAQGYWTTSGLQYIPPPSAELVKRDFMKIFSGQVPTFAAGDLNAKSTMWGSRLNNTHGRWFAKVVVGQPLLLTLELV